ARRCITEVAELLRDVLLIRREITGELRRLRSDQEPERADHGERDRRRHAHRGYARPTRATKERHDRGQQTAPEKCDSEGTQHGPADREPGDDRPGADRARQRAVASAPLAFGVRMAVRRRLAARIHPCSVNRASIAYRTRSESKSHATRFSAPS